MKIVIGKDGIVQVLDRTDDNTRKNKIFTNLNIDLPTFVRGATLYVSGSPLKANSMSGSLTQLVDKKSYLVAGPGISITSESNGQITIQSTATEALSTVWREVPAGAIDGSNGTFTLAFTPDPPESLLLFKNGLAMFEASDGDFTLSGQTITFNPENIPTSGSVIFARYNQ